MSRRVSAKVKRSVLFLAAGGALVLSAIWLAALPRDPDTLESMAVTSLEKKEPRRALEELDLAIDQVGSDSPADRQRRYDLLTKRGRVNLDLLNRPTHALDDFRDAQALEPGDPRAWDRFGSALLKLGQFADAARHFELAAATFPDRDRWYRYSAACAHWRQSREHENPGEAMIRMQVRPGRERELDRALELFASSGPYRQSQEEIESTLLRPPRGTAEVREGFALLLRAREEFVKAEREMADYESSPELAPQFVRVRLEMDRQTGRYYELCRTAELLLRCPLDPRDFTEIYEIQLLRINALRQLGRSSAVTEALAALRDQCSRWSNPGVAAEGEGSAALRRSMVNAMVATQFRLLDELIATGRRREALEQLRYFQGGTDNKRWLTYQLHAGIVLQANGRDSEAIAPLEDAAAFVLDPSNDLAQVFHDPVEQRRQVGWLADALLGAGRPELALRLFDQLLESSPDLPEFVAGRAAALRARGDRARADVTAADLELMKVGRDGGRRLATWEADWLALKGQPVQLARSVAEQSARVLRLFSSDLTSDKSTVELVQAAIKARTNGKAFVTAKDATIETAGFALLRGLESEPAMVLQVYRRLVGQGFRDQAFLLLCGLVEAQPAVADFRLLLARHDLADGRLEDALVILKTLREMLPDDEEIAALAATTARRLGDPIRAHRIEESALGDAPSNAALRLAVRGCLADGYAELVVAAARDATVETAEGRELFGLTARALQQLGDAASAEALAQQVLAKEATQRDALAALLVAGVARRLDDGSTACDAWLAANQPLLAEIDADALTEVGRAVLAAGGATSAEQLLRLALARDPTQSAARLALADALLVLGRYDELDALLDPAKLDQDDVEATARLALRALLRDGAAAANSFLAGRVAIGAPEDRLALWIGLTAAAAGRIADASTVLERRRVGLDDDETRFLALCALAWNARPADTAALPAIATIARAATDATTRDRELERLLSLDLASPHHQLLESLAALVMLERVADLAPLRDVLKARFLAAHPSPGALARDDAMARLEGGDAAGAAALLQAQASADPRDDETLRALTACAELLPAEQLDALCEAARQAGGPPGLAKVLAALRDEVRGDVASASAQLDEAAKSDDPPTHAAALLVRARFVVRDARLATTSSADLPPWCRAGERERAAAAESAGDALLAEAAVVAPSDPLVLATLRARLRTGNARIAPARRDAFVATLVTQPTPWFEAYEAALAADGDGAPKRERVEALGQSLDLALKNVRGGTLPLPAVRTLVRLAERARLLDMNDAAQRWLARASAACPHHPALQAAKGRIALATGDERGARRAFARASLFGSDAPDVLHWLGGDALQAGRPQAARDLEVRALKAAPADDPVARAGMNEVLARARYLLADTDGSRRAWTAAAVERGADPRLSLPIALETFATKGPVAAKSLLAPLATTPGPARALAKELLKIALAEDPTPVEASAPPPAVTKPDVPPKRRKPKQ